MLGSGCQQLDPRATSQPKPILTQTPATTSDASLELKILRTRGKQPSYLLEPCVTGNCLLFLPCLCAALPRYEKAFIVC